MKERVQVLNAIFSYFQQITQWLPSHCSNAAKYADKAAALIEFLEVQDCGSIGGFDKDSPLKHESNFELYDRFLALVRKYENQKDIKPICGFNINKMQKYFIALSELRTKYSK